MEETMEDLSSVQGELNDEAKKRQYERLRTPEGAKAYISGKIGRFVNNLMQKKVYQINFAIIFTYLLGCGFYYAFASLFTIKTIVVVLLVISTIYWKEIKIAYSFIKKWTLEIIFFIHVSYINIKVYTNNLIYKIRGVFRRKKSTTEE